jgi:hypothetical protein
MKMIVTRLAMTLALILTLAVSPAQAQNESDDAFRYQYMVDFWRENPPGTTLSDDPGENAPGHLVDIRVAHRTKLPPAQAALLERRLRLILNTLLEQPSLKDIKGSSLIVYLTLDRNLAGMPSGMVSIISGPIFWGHPHTKIINGRYHTETSPQAELRIKLNGRLNWLNVERVRMLGSYEGSGLAEADAKPFLFVVNNGRTPIFSDSFVYNGISYGHWNKDFYDRSASPNKVQYLAGRIIHTAYYDGLYDGTHPPTSNLGRLMAALYMVDWPAVVQKLDAIK